MRDEALREGVVAIARDAGAAIMAVHDGDDFGVRAKADASPVTAADLAAHHCIVHGLTRLTPDIPVLSEESAHAVPTGRRRAWSRFWLVDPLDGTREFLKRNGEFTVNIALVDHGVPVFGVIQAPVGGAVWHGAPGEGAFRRDGDAERPIATRRPATAPLRVAASRSHLDPRTAALLQRLGAHETIGLGSSLKFCLLAEGGMDAYPRMGPTSEWDTAAGQAILEAAGGCVLDLQGRPFRYNQRDTLLNGHFIALGDPALPWRSWM
ncbi:3'(2'),5'-bisphosphate nucleotidase CysQ [Luteimonas sp. MC1750]|uniref:3'(2'),5'-bisphosphate nucleotidase CysQ n=1 Tax=Luteimonas sp. MC1750 TaxID=2799326 RepID=UPI0018F06AB8|nr:3'(2'),5'-bisphosphate nucleotidase CysQ [Luteimonas sp. MC1750]MBJ6985384.1 3'(2'),5'-bisphosphate nucleotidase CysQ [Luteimonas sp. MC1750]QQO05357.1 3'(2'),5'-bisphosphate nucleotidase CysQ [Luteimonas sp. MC1750]